MLTKCLSLIPWSMLLSLSVLVLVLVLFSMSLLLSMLMLMMLLESTLHDRCTCNLLVPCDNPARRLMRLCSRILDPLCPFHLQNNSFRSLLPWFGFALCNP